MENLAEQAARNLRAVRERKPLVHNITNFVVMNYTANALLAMGASPVMAHAIGEVEEMVSHAGALVLNIGTLTEEWVAAMIAAGRKANEKKIPIVLDPVGSGATRLRTESARKILSQTRVSVLRGNASEILSLQDDNSRTKGVDAVHGVDEAARTAGILAAELGPTLAITGPVDLITDGQTRGSGCQRSSAHGQRHGHRLYGNGSRRGVSGRRPGSAQRRGHGAGVLRAGRRGSRCQRYLHRAVS